MYENCGCCEFDDVIFNWILEASFFVFGGPFSCNKSVIFGQLASVTKLFAKYHAGTERSL